MPDMAFAEELLQIEEADACSNTSSRPAVRARTATRSSSRGPGRVSRSACVPSGHAVPACGPRRPEARRSLGGGGAADSLEVRHIPTPFTPYAARGAPLRRGWAARANTRRHDSCPGSGFDDEDDEQAPTQAVTVQEAGASRLSRRPRRPRHGGRAALGDNRRPEAPPRLARRARPVSRAGRRLLPAAPASRAAAALRGRQLSRRAARPPVPRSSRPPAQPGRASPPGQSPPCRSRSSSLRRRNLNQDKNRVSSC